MIGARAMKIASFAFAMSLSFMATHEIDAGMHGEWRLLPVLSAMDDATAASWFVMLHVPLFIVIIWLAFLADGRTMRTSQIILSALFVLHGAAHLMLGRHPEYPFEEVRSSFLVHGALVFALFSLVLHIRSGNRELQS